MKASCVLRAAMFVSAAGIVGLTPEFSSADMLISQAILDFATTGDRRRDVEVGNSGRERMYVVVEPALIENPGTVGERRVAEPDPEKLGLLVTPTRLVLEPGERKVIRISLLREPPVADRVYRVMIKPAVGRVQSDQSAVKILVGYDVLVIQRPVAARDDVSFTRQGPWLTLRNGGNTNVLLSDGKQCDAAGHNCRTLETKRLYAGAQWRVRLPHGGPVTYSLQVGNNVVRRSF